MATSAVFAAAAATGTPSVAPSSASSSASSSSGLQCANCDEPLSQHPRSAASAAFTCDECCDADVSPACLPCSVQLHRPMKGRRHHIRLMLPPLPPSPGTDEAAAATAAAADSTAALAAASVFSAEADDDDDVPPATEGHGFCDSCMIRCRDVSAVELLRHPPRLSVLSCEGCDGDERHQGGLCLRCDLRVHRSLDADAHTRVFFSARHAADSLEGSRLQHSSFVVAGLPIRVAHRDALASYAGRIWPGSAMLCRYIELEHERAVKAGQPSPFAGKRVVELGAGCAALPSLCCWLLGAAAVVASDMNSDGLAVLRENIQDVRQQVQQQQQKQEQESGSNNSGAVPHLPAACSGQMSAVPLRFGDALPSALEGPWDVVLGSYILYDADCFPALARSLSALSGPSSVALLTSHEPTREAALREELAKQGLRVRRVPFSLQDARVTGHADDCHAEAGAVPIALATCSGRGDRGDTDATGAASAPVAAAAAVESIGLRSTSILIVTRGEGGLRFR